MLHPEGSSWWTPDPTVEPLSTKTVGDILDSTCLSLPNSEAIVVSEFEGFDARWTYADLKMRVDAVAKGLMSLGVTRQSRVGIWAPNLPEWMVVWFATAKVGAVLVPLNPGYKRDELVHVLHETGVETLFLLPEFRGSSLSSIADAALHDLPDLANVFSIQYDGGTYPGLTKLVERGAASVSSAELDRRQADVDSRDVAMIIYTSGTTGRPKGAQLTHRSIVNSARETSRHWRIDEKQRYCNPFPFFHISGSVLIGLASVLRGACHLPLPWFSPQRMLATISTERVTACWFVPTMLTRVLDTWSQSPEKYDVSSLQVCGIGGSTTPIGLHAKLDSLWGVRLCSGYGSTEMSSGIAQVATDEKDRVCASGVGRPLPGVEMRLVNDCGQVVPLGVPGELQARGYMMMEGYLDDANGGLDPDGWITPGDLAVMDRHGCLAIVGRTKDMIIRGGENLYPAEIESRLLEHPKVHEAVVVGVPDEDLGEEACACICLNEPADVSEILAWLRQRVAREKVPRYVLFLDSFPLSPTGKIVRGSLRSHVASLHGEGRLLSLASEGMNSERMSSASGD